MLAKVIHPAVQLPDRPASLNATQGVGTQDYPVCALTLCSVSEESKYSCSGSAILGVPGGSRAGWA